MNTITSPTQEYGVGERLGATDSFNLYECQLPDGSPAILKIAASPEANGILDREAFVLQMLLERADYIEAKAASEEPEKGSMGYRCFFPHLVESFISLDQGGRRISILGFAEVALKLGELAPLPHLLSLEHVRVDPKTSVWIMGKLLKLLDFAHSIGCTVPAIGENILINRDRHTVTVFDWIESTITDGPVLPEIASREIAQAAREVIIALGGEPTTGQLPADPDLEDEWYQEMLMSLASGEYTNAGEAHTLFYQFVRSRWPSKFHPFAAYPVRIVEKPKTHETETTATTETTEE